MIIRRARIEEVRDLADAYRRELEEERELPADPPLPQGGVYWIALDADDDRRLGYAAGTLRPTGLTIGPVYTCPEARGRGVGGALVAAVQSWATDTGVPVVEISVAARNDDALRFLTALGYQPRRVLMSLRPDASTAEDAGATHTGEEANALTDVGTEDGDGNDAG